MIKWTQINLELYQTEYHGFTARVVKRGHSWIYSIDTPDQVCAYVYGDRYSDNDPLWTANHAKHKTAYRLKSLVYLKEMF